MARLAIALILLLWPASLYAAGGAHIVDDAAVETAGHCHMEGWETTAGRRSGLGNVDIACTPATAPRLELGGFLVRSFRAGTAETVFGLTPKLMLRDESHGFGIGLSGILGFAGSGGGAQTASLIVPVTLPIRAGLRVNLNGGVIWVRHDRHPDGFAGAQAEWQIGERLGAMIEAFGRDAGSIGEQAGLRLTCDQGRIDLDLLLAAHPDAATRHAVTLGLTIRR